MAEMVRAGRSFLAVVFVPELGKESMASASPAGEPPVQLPGSDQRSDVAPVQMCVAKSTRSSRASRGGRCRLARRQARRGVTRGDRIIASAPCADADES